MRWQTTGTDFDVDDQVGGESDLEVGQLVVVRGTVSAEGNAIAETIERDPELEGPITAIDLTAETITVLQQTVVVAADTVIEAAGGSDIADLVVGDFVEVDAYRQSGGSLRAVRIEVEAEPDEFEISGQVSNLDTSASTFNLGDLVIDYASAMMEDFGSHLLADGDHVEVEGTEIGAGGELIAIKVELEDDRFDGAEEFELEGVITTVNEDGSFQLAGMTVLLDDAVVFENGAASDLVVDAEVEAEGYIDDAGNLVATEIEIEREANIEIFAPVQTVDAAAGTLSALGIEFVARADTRFDDDSALEVRTFDLSDLLAGDWVAVEAYRDEGTGETVAVAVSRADAEGDDIVAIEGPVDSVDGDQLVLMGVTVTLDVSSELDEDAGFASVADFLASLAPDTLIEAEGLQTGESAVTATEVGMED